MGARETAFGYSSAFYAAIERARVHAVDGRRTVGDPTIVVLPLTTQMRPSKEPLHVTIRARATIWRNHAK
jgi:hypothetical protein